MSCRCEVMGGSCVGLGGVGGRAGRRGLSGIDGRGRGRVGIGVCGVLAGSGAGIEAEGGGGAVLAGWALFAVVVSSWHGLAAIGRIGVGGVDPGGGGVACWVGLLGSCGAWLEGAGRRGAASEAMVASSWEVALAAVVAELSRRPSIVWGSSSEP